MGENGAGKSTLIKAITGAQRLDGGRITLRGRPVVFSRPAEAVAAGIAAVYQEIELVPELSVAENVMLGDEPRRFGGIDWREMRRQASRALSQLGIDLDPASSLRSHSPAVQQLVAIARAVRTRPDVLVLDEPTSSLDQDEVAQLFDIMRGLKAEGVAILFISHFLEQVYEIADRLTILRNGRLVGEYLTADILRIELVERMLGTTAKALDDLEERGREELAAPDARIVVQATGLGRSNRIAPFDLTVREGEILGFAGLMGAGRTEVARALVGADPRDGGTVMLRGKPIHISNPAQAVRHGIGYLSEDRKRFGLLLDQDVKFNIALSSLRPQFTRAGFVRDKAVQAAAKERVDALRIKTSSVQQMARNLSGGNQQKVVVAKWLLKNCDVLIFDEPTRGIDVGAKEEIYQLLNALAQSGKSIIMISSELPEILRMSHRILVMSEGRVTRILDTADASQELLMHFATLRPDENPDDAAELANLDVAAGANAQGQKASQG
jgi:ribose transport system ATP-binding protein